MAGLKIGYETALEDRARLRKQNETLLKALKAIVEWDDASPEYNLAALDELPGIIDDARTVIDSCN